MKYNTYYNDCENRLFKNLASTFIRHRKPTGFIRINYEGETIWYDKKEYERILSSRKSTIR